MSGTESWWWPALAYGLIAVVGIIGVLCKLPLDHPRYGRISGLAHFGLFLAIAGVLLASAIFLTSRGNAVGWYTFGGGVVFLLLARTAWRHAQDRRPQRNDARR